MGNVFSRPSRAVVRPALVEHPKSKAELLTWAGQYSYPALSFRGVTPVRLCAVGNLPAVEQPLWYSIGLEGYKGNKEFWETALQFGTQDLIEGLLKHVSTLSKEQLEDMKPRRQHHDFHISILPVDKSTGMEA